jgi:hypothetical protein
VTFADRLRRDLQRAGVYRLPPLEVTREVRVGRGTNTRTVVERQPDPLDPLYCETATSLPVDFHSFRRAFVTAIAEAGVNVQTAMTLAAHSDPKVHARYIMATTAMRKVPDAALPRLGEVVEALETSREGLTVDETTPEGASSEPSQVGDITEELCGAGEGIRTLDVHLGNASGPHETRKNEPDCERESSTRAEYTTACFTVSRDDSSGSVNATRAEYTDATRVDCNDDRGDRETESGARPATLLEALAEATRLAVTEGRIDIARELLGLVERARSQAAETTGLLPLRLRSK